MIILSWFFFKAIEFQAVACDCLFFRDGRNEPSFSKVINALKIFHKASTSHGKVIFHGKPKVRT